MCCQIESYLATLQTKPVTSMREEKTGYRFDFDGQVRETPPLQVSSYVFVYKQPLATTSEPSTGALAGIKYNVLQRQTSGLHRIFYIRSNIINEDKYNVPHTIFTDRVTHASSANTKHRYDETPHEAQQTANVKAHKKNPATQTPPSANITDQYVVDIAI